MRSLLFVLYISVLLSCNQEGPKKIILPNGEVSDNKDIFDSWAMCSTFDGKQVAQMNVCPIITFISNGSGYVTSNTSITESFTWSLKKAHMKILYKRITSNSTFPDTNYYAEFTKQNDIMNLLLKHNDNSYYLSKSIEQ